MFCSNCGKEMENQMLFCPACGTSVGKSGNDKSGEQHLEKTKKGVFVKEDFEPLRQLTEKASKKEKLWGIIGKILAVLYVVLIGKGLLDAVDDVLSGEAGMWHILNSISVVVLFACGIAYMIFEICIPMVKVKKARYAEEYLKYICIEDNNELLKALHQMKCSVIKSAYMDEKGNVCVQGKTGSHTFSVEDDLLVLKSHKENYKTVLERETIAGVLLKFLAPDAPVNAYKKEQNNMRLAKVKMVLAVLAAVSGCIVVITALNPGMAEGQQKYIQMVKEGCPQAYPDVTYEEAFGAFFSDCNWEYFKSTENEDVVEFYGNCYYDEEEAEIKMQFLISYEERSGELYALTINGEPQSDFVQAIIVTDIFESYILGEEPQNIQLEDGEKEENTNVENNEDVMTEAMIEETVSEQETIEIASDITFPILSQGYTEGYLCPVMLSDEQLTGGTYEEMFASCVNDGVTMYATPVMQEGIIHTATKWDVPDIDWYQGLLTYEQFLSLVSWMNETHIMTGLDTIYSSAQWEAVAALSGKWSDATYDISISIYSDSAFYDAYDEIGSFNIEEMGVSGTIQLLGSGDGDVFVLCRTAEGAEMELCYKSDGTIEVITVSEEYGFLVGEPLICIERYMS